MEEAYLLGVCAEIQGELNKALVYYEKADRMTERPVKEINEGIERIKIRLKNQKEIKGR